MNREAPDSGVSRPIHQKSNRFRTRGLEAAAAGLALSAVAQPASATIISSAGLSADPETLLTPDGVLAGALNLIFELGTNNEISLSLAVEPVSSMVAGMSGMSVFTGMAASTGQQDEISVQLATFTTDPTGSGTNYLQLLDPGEVIGGGLSYEDQGYLIDDDVVNPEWALDPDGIGFAGFVFSTADGETFYGWVEIDFDQAGSDFTILGWAYDDSGIPIPAGVPEPSTGLLLALGLAGLTAVARRRRREFGKRFH
jgi:hypothetical protein